MPDAREFETTSQMLLENKPRSTSENPPTEKREKKKWNEQSDKDGNNMDSWMTNTARMIAAPPLLLSFDYILSTTVICKSRSENDRQARIICQVGADIVCQHGMRQNNITGGCKYLRAWAITQINSILPMNLLPFSPAGPIEHFRHDVMRSRIYGQITHVFA